LSQFSALLQETTVANSEQTCWCNAWFV